MIEKLKQLEERWRGESWINATPEAISIIHANELAVLIAEAERQEPVAEIRGDMKGGGFVHFLTDQAFEPGTKLYTSPTGQTSDARDAKVAELIEATRRLTADIEFRIDDPRSQLLDRARRATTAAVGCDCPGSAKVSYLSHAPNCPAREALGKFAAMRQEGGSDA